MHELKTINYYLFSIVEGNEIRGSESDFIFCHFAVTDKT